MSVMVSGGGGGSGAAGRVARGLGVVVLGLGLAAVGCASDDSGSPASVTVVSTAPSSTAPSSTEPPSESSTTSPPETSPPETSPPETSPPETSPPETPPVPAASCPPQLPDGDPFYTYAAMCRGGWAVVLQAGCVNGRSDGVVFRDDGGTWTQVGGYGDFDGWPPLEPDLVAIGVPASLAAEFASAPDRPPGSDCDTWVVP